MDPKITYDRSRRIGKGGFAIVFHGTFNGFPVAVKRIEHERRCDDKEEKALEMFNHSNIVKLYTFEETNDFRFYAFELCSGSLDQLFLSEDDPRKYRGPPLPRHTIVLLQLTKGLAYIHSKRLVHRDIKPENVLISITSDPVTLKWADFGLTKATSECGTYEMSGQKGTLYWMAPEILEYFNYRGPLDDGANNKFTVSTDIFSAGCLFFSIVAYGSHPFGDHIAKDILTNIQSNNPVNFLNKDILSTTHFSRDCIAKMLESNPSNRWNTQKITKYIKSKVKMERCDLCSSFYNPTSGAQMDQLSKLVQEKDCPSPNTTNIEGLTPLELLCNWTNKNNPKLKRCMEILLKVDTKNKTPSAPPSNKKSRSSSEVVNGTRALFFTCGSYTHDDLRDIIQLLLDHTNFDFRTRTHFGCTKNIFSEILYNPRLRKNLNELEEVIQLLKNYGFKINQQLEGGERNSLHTLIYIVPSSTITIGENVVGIGQLLIDNGIDVNATINGDNALQLLLRFPNVKDELEIVQMLIKKGIDINKKNRYGDNALHCLLNRFDRNNAIEILQILIQNGIHINSKSHNGRNAIHNLFNGFNHERMNITMRILQLLLEEGIEVNSLDQNGWNGLFYLSLYSHVKPGTVEANIVIVMAKMLIGKGINVHLRDKYGQTALHHFKSGGRDNANNLELIKLLKGKRVKQI